MEVKQLKAEAVLRIFALVFVAMEALLVGLNSQTKVVFFIQRKATSKDVEALWVLTIIAGVAACYHLLQLCKCLTMYCVENNPFVGCKVMPWLTFLLDQGMTYVLFATTLASLQASLVALRGVPDFQWTKVCNVYTRFCDQIGGGLFCGLVATLSMITLSSLSAYQLFRPKSAHKC